MNEIHTIILYTLLTTLSVALLIEMLHYLLLGTTIIRHNRKKTSTPTTTDPNETTATLPPVSVIICAKNEEENIKNFLPLVLEQDYPEYEVIVVNDGSTDDTEQTLVNLQKLYPHLYLTNIPEQTRIISHKKLAVTIGVKAAKNEILIFTDADCRPWTSHWIENIVRTYTPDTQYVLGYGAYYTTKHPISRLISYDTLTIAIQYMGLAILHKPYMAVGRNMSYRKSAFLKNKGFAGQLHIPSGDDDLLINHFATKTNTAVNSTLETKTISLPKQSFSDWYYQKLRHLSASAAYTTRSKSIISVEPIARGLFWLSTLILLTCFHTQPYIIPAVAAALILKLTIQSIIINHIANYYKEPKFNPLTITILDIFLPLVTLYIGTIGRLFTKQIRWK